MVKNLPAMQEIQELITGSGRSGRRNGNPLQNSYLENLMDRGAWRAIVHGVAKRWSRLSDLAHSNTHTANNTSLVMNILLRGIAPLNRKV